MSLQKKERNFDDETSLFGLKSPKCFLVYEHINVQRRVNSELLEYLKKENQSLKDKNKSICEEIFFRKIIMFLLLVFILYKFIA